MEISLLNSAENESNTILLNIPSPKNFSIKHFDLHSNTINITVQWQAPDYPISGYQVRNRLYELVSILIFTFFDDSFD